MENFHHTDSFRTQAEAVTSRSGKLTQLRMCALSLYKGKQAVLIGDRKAVEASVHSFPGILHIAFLRRPCREKISSILKPQAFRGMKKAV